MCLVVFAWKAHPEFPLIVAANRDEYHGRPAREAGWWPDAPDVLAGRDLEAGGTWLALSRSRRFATVTNYREGRQPRQGLRSRGEIATNFVRGSESALDFVTGLNGDRYAGVNVLVADEDSLGYVSNRGDSPVSLPPGVYGLSNASLDTPWSKLVRTRDGLAQLVDDDDADRTALLRLLANRTQASVGEVDSSELPFSLARALTAPFIVAGDYGTRCTTIVSIRRNGGAEFHERRFSARGGISGESTFTF